MQRKFHLYALALMLTGCATTHTSVPTAENFPHTSQKKALAAQHWNFIASDIVEQTRVSLAKHQYVNGETLYVVPNSESQFDQVFRNYMISNLVNADLPVSATPLGALEIKYETQIIQHKSPFDPASHGYKPGTATAVVGGLWVLRDAARHWSIGNAVAATLGGAVAYDLYKSLESKNALPTNTELLITTSLVNKVNGQYLMRKTDAYYIDREETFLFTPPPPPTAFKEWKVTGQ